MTGQNFAGCRHGALAVVETPKSKSQISRQLRALNEHLFLELQLREGDYGETYQVWCVCLNAGREGIATVLEWRDPDGNPIPYLSDRIVSEMERRYRRGPLELQQIIRANEEKKQRDRDDYNAQLRELVEEHHPLSLETHSGLLHRGVGLRMARDRQRARGAKV